MASGGGVDMINKQLGTRNIWQPTCSGP